MYADEGGGGVSDQPRRRVGGGGCRDSVMLQLLQEEAEGVRGHRLPGEGDVWD